MTEQERFERWKAAERGIEYERFKLNHDIREENYGVRYHQLSLIASDWKVWSAATAQAFPQVEDHEYLIVNFGYGEIEVAEGISEDAYALILGNNGMGSVGADLQGNRLMTKQETIAVLKFYNLAAIDVVLARLDVLRERMKNNEPVEIKNNDGEVIKVVNIKLQAAQEGE